jgi:hypothetical protein
MIVKWWVSAGRPFADARPKTKRSRCLVLRGRSVAEAPAEFEVLPVGGLERALEGGHLVAVAAS